MSSDKYLDLDIKKLFEQHHAKDIEFIQKQMQHESDRKKIELRTLVGERYRDLIQAADTIAEMKNTSESVMTKIITIEERFHALQQQYLIGFKMDEDTEHANVQRQSSYMTDSIVLQIKILMDIPEHIWSAIDDQNFLLATQLFLLAQHVNYSLTFQVGNSNLIKKYPVVSKQWGIISQFKNLLLNFCNDALKSVQLSVELAANCLAALVLLNGLNMSELINILILYRNQTLQSIATSESNISVKNKLKLCLTILIETSTLISSCFIQHKDNQGGLVMLLINNVKDKDAFFMLSQLDLEEELLDKYLPSVARNHKPFVQHELQSLPLNNIQEILNKWFQWVKQFAKVEVKKLLDLILSIKGIYNIREECLAVDIPENWNSIWEIFSLPSVNFWIECFQPLLTDRIKGILNDTMSNCFISLKKDTIELLTKLLNDSFPYKENDLRWFIWKDSPNDIPQKLVKGPLTDNKRPLLMKARGFSPNILQLCENFENGLNEVLMHLKQYLYEVEHTSALKDDLLTSDIYSAANKFCDRNEIQEFLQSISSTLIEQYIIFVKEECLVSNPKFGCQDVNAIVTARFLQAIPILCSNFKECFTISRPTGLTLTNIKWQEICDKLKEEVTLIWFVWSKCFIKIIKEYGNEYLIKENIDDLKIHMIITDWEKVVIEEEAEEGKRIKSEILVPYQPTVQLQTFLSYTCKELNKVIPHTIPKSVINEIINNVVLELLEYYYNLSTNTDIRQKQAIQILFDVKYLSLLMVPRDNKSVIEQSNKVCNNIIAKIDPFDFDVFYPYINSNVKKGVQRSLLIFGNLVPHMEELHSVLGARIDAGAGLKSVKDPPGVLALCTGAPWFPPLAVTAPTQKLPALPLPAAEKAQPKKKQLHKEHTRTDSTGSTIKSGAAAFFGAMGSDWFGTS